MNGSVQVRVAAVLVGLGAVLGLALVVLGLRLFTVHDDLLLVVIPVVATALVCAGTFLAGSAAAIAVRLHRGHPAARLQTAVLALVCLVLGGFLLVASAVAAVVLLLYGGTLLLLMTSPAAARDLGPWRRAVGQPAPWGSTPGTRVWSPQPPQQGPWSPDPTTLPWLGWQDRSGPRPPWWVTWQAGLAQGLPLWELLLVGAGVVCTLAGLVAVLASVGSPGARAWVVLVPVGIAPVWYVERRMRARLAGRR